MKLLLDSGRGVYIPQAFAQYHADEFGFRDTVQGWTYREAIEVLVEGPYANEYDEAWGVILSNAKMKGKRNWTLHQDGDLWAGTSAQIRKHFAD
jgi:hypothetical protein